MDHYYKEQEITTDEITDELYFRDEIDIYDSRFDAHADNYIFLKVGTMIPRDDMLLYGDFHSKKWELTVSNYIDENKILNEKYFRFIRRVYRKNDDMLIYERYLFNNTFTFRDGHKLSHHSFHLRNMKKL